MHELAVTENILSIALDHARREKARRVTALHIVIGELSSFAGDSIRFYWDILAKGTICEGAELCFERPPARLECLDCGRSYGLEGGMGPCPDCGSHRVKIAAGMEFRLDSITIDAEDQETENLP